MRGELEIRAIFPDGNVKITQFELTKIAERGISHGLNEFNEFNPWLINKL